MVLSELAVGASACITGYCTAHTVYRHKLLSLGLTRGTTLVLERKAPLGDPLQIRLRGFSLSLRKEEAQMICIELKSL